MLVSSHYTSKQDNCNSWRGSSQRLTLDRFIEDSRRVHGDKYDYSLVEYSNNSTNVTIICRSHGEFFQSPKKHKIGQGCPLCANESRNNCRRMTMDDFLMRARKVHRTVYAYDKTVIVGIDSPCIVTCSTHGDFLQTPYKHLSGQGCPVCRYDKTSKKLRKSVEKFTEDAQMVHGQKYDYSKVVYRRGNVKVEIVCGTHGSFYQTPSNHLMGDGCPHCSRSLGEIAICDHLNALGIQYIRQAKFDDCRNINKLPFDFYVASLNMLIEYDGKQHFEPVTDFGGVESHEKTIRNDLIKNEWAKAKKMRLIRIPYWDFGKIPTIINEAIGT